MNVLINISDEIYRHAKDGSEDSNDEWNAMRAIANGISIPDNATFGDTFEKVFRPFKVVKEGLSVDVYRTKSRFENNIVWFTFSIMQWNAPYQKGGKG